MNTAIAVDLGRQTLQAAMILAFPLLAAATLVSLLVNIGQVLTSLQETTISTVPRLLTMGRIAFVLMPWMVRRLAMFTINLMRDFTVYLR